MKRPKSPFGTDVPEKGREVGAFRRHERNRALEARYRRIGKVRYSDPAHVIADGYDYLTRLPRADWSHVIERRRRDAVLQLDTRTPCSCLMCGNPRRYLGDSRAEVRAALDAREEIAGLSGDL